MSGITHRFVYVFKKVLFDFQFCKRNSKCGLVGAYTTNKKYSSTIIERNKKGKSRQCHRRLPSKIAKVCTHYTISFLSGLSQVQKVQKQNICKVSHLPLFALVYVQMLNVEKFTSLR